MYSCYLWRTDLALTETLPRPYLDPTETLPRSDLTDPVTERSECYWLRYLPPTMLRRSAIACVSTAHRTANSVCTVCTVCALCVHCVVPVLRTRCALCGTDISYRATHCAAMVLPGCVPDPTPPLCCPWRMLPILVPKFPYRGTVRHIPNTSTQYRWSPIPVPLSQYRLYPTSVPLNPYPSSAHPYLSTAHPRCFPIPVPHISYAPLSQYRASPISVPCIARTSLKGIDPKGIDPGRAHSTQPHTQDRSS
eukprot:2693641-Rhodomonas_salina.3